MKRKPLSVFLFLIWIAFCGFAGFRMHAEIIQWQIRKYHKEILIRGKPGDEGLDCCPVPDEVQGQEDSR